MDEPVRAEESASFPQDAQERAIHSRCWWDEDHYRMGSPKIHDFGINKPRHGYEAFYTREERIAFHERLEIPARTRVWVGALDRFHLGGHATDFTINGDGGKTRIGKVFVSTIYMGYVVCQAVTEHFYLGISIDRIPPIEPPASSSDSKLIQIYTQVSKKADWPPAPFTNGGPNGMAYLMLRWRQGEKVSMIREDGVVRSVTKNALLNSQLGT